MSKANKMFLKEKNAGKYSLRILIALILIGIFLFISLIGFITDYLWFKELKYVGVFFTKLFTQLKIGIPTFVILTFLSYIYFKLIKKKYYHRIISDDIEKAGTINWISWLLAAVFGGIVTYFVVTNLWFSWLQFINGKQFNIKDPIFGLDVSFYVFKLDFLTQLNTIFIIVLALYLVMTILYYILLILNRPPRIFKDENAESFEEPDRFDGSNANIGGSTKKYDGLFKGTPLENLFAKIDKAGQKREYERNINKAGDSFGGAKLDDQNMKMLFSIAAPQLMVAGALLFAMIFIHFVLAQFELLHAHTGAVYGAGYTDTHITLWIYRILSVLSLAGAVMVVVGVKRHRLKTIFVVPMIMIVLGILGVGTEAAVQNLIVSPNEIAKESPYLERNIKYTQKAYGLDKVKIRTFSADNKLTAKDIKNNDPTISNIRINDYEPAEAFYNQTQAIRQYYEFNDVDVDRYMINGEYTQSFLSPREIDEEKISQTWLNKHLKYTHGYGITLSRVDEVTSSGQPRMLIEKIPPESKIKEIKLKRPEIYFGELTNSYAITGANEEEFDYPDGDNNAYSRYKGKAGIKLSPLNRFMFAIREKSLKLLVSTNVNSKSRIIINRNIAQRAKAIMPYLKYDDDPYMVTVNGKLYWIIDAYTRSDRFPYSEKTDEEGTNYIRNSVKVVIDAYNGDTSYYVVDENEPIANTFKKIYPELFKSADKMPTEIKKHLRYPNALFDVQAKVYRRYHMNDVKVFYQNEDLWDIANEIYGTKEKPMIPNYYIINLPGEKKAEFVNSISFTPKDKKNMTGLFLARNDGDKYGELVLFKLPKSKVVYGPRQIEAQIDQDTEISKEFSLWDSAGSKYSRGNMFVIPIENSLLYVEPVYLEASESSIPEVKRVIVAYGDKIAYKQTLGEALDTLFGQGTTSRNKKPGQGKVVTQADLIRRAKSTYDKAVEAQKKGDWAEYGKNMKELENILKQLR